MSKGIVIAGVVASLVAMPLVGLAKDGQGQFERESHRSVAVQTVRVRGVVTAVSATSITVTGAPRVEDNHNGNQNGNTNSDDNSNTNGNSNGNTNSVVTPVVTTLAINESTIVIGKHSRRARVSDIQVGDRVTVRATSRTNGVALKIEDKAIRLVEVKGFFQNVNARTNSFTVTRRPSGLGKMTNVTVDAQTVITKKQVGVISLGVVMNGDHGKVIGRWNATTNTLEARSISVK